MSDNASALADFRKYAALLRSSIAPGNPFEPQSEDASTIQVERGIVFPHALGTAANPHLSSIDRVLKLSTSERLAGIAAVDRNGHQRSVYRALLVYSCLKAFAIVYERIGRSDFGRWEEGLRPWCDLLESDLGKMTWPRGPIPAALGSGAAEAAWIALALQIAAKLFVRDVWSDLASDTFGRIMRSQNEDGSFLLATPSDNPETLGYHELLLLHAAASYAVQAEDRTLAAAVARNAAFQQNLYQPDHATTQPWALFAFIWNPATRPLADQILHAASASKTDISLMLFADALYCIELFTKAAE